MTRLALCLLVAVAACDSSTRESPPPAVATLAFTMDSSIWVVTTADSAAFELWREGHKISAFYGRGSVTQRDGVNH